MVKKDTPEWEEWKEKLKGFRERVEDLIDKTGSRYMIGFVDGLNHAKRIVDGSVDKPKYFTLS